MFLIFSNFLPSPKAFLCDSDGGKKKKLKKRLADITNLITYGEGELEDNSEGRRCVSEG